MTDYSKTKIYKIESHLGDNIYVGSTSKEYLSQRFQQHKSSYKLWKLGKSNKIRAYELFEEYGFENCQIVLIESYPCNCKDEKNLREGHYIKELNCVNKNVAGRNPKESMKAYQESDKGKETRKEYLQSDKYKNTQNAYLESDKGKETKKAYRDSGRKKEVVKDYYETNKETISKHKKSYYLKNKEKILEREKQNYQLKKSKKLEEDNNTSIII